MASRQQFGVPRKRPNLGYCFLVMIAEPVREPIAKNCAKNSRNPVWPEINARSAEHSAGAKKNSRGRQKQRNKSKRLSESENENNRRSPSFMILEQSQDRPRKIADGTLPFPPRRLRDKLGSPKAFEPLQRRQHAHDDDRNQREIIAMQGTKAE